MSEEQKQEQPQPEKKVVAFKPSDFGIDEATAKKGAAVAKVKPDQVIGYREYSERGVAVVVVHRAKSVEKVEGPIPAEKAAK